MNKRLLWVIPPVLTFWIAQVIEADADRILKVDGRVVDGIIESRQSDGRGGEILTIRIGAGKITLSSSEIQRIIPSTSAGNELIQARDFLKEGQPDRAVQSMTDAIGQGADADEVAALALTFGEDLVKAVPTMTPKAREQLGGVLKTVASSQLPRIDDLIATRLRLHLMLGEREQAAVLFDSLGPEYFKNHPAIRQNLAQWLLDSLTDKFRIEDYPRVLDLLDDLKRVDPGIAEGRQTQFYLQWARLARYNKHFDQALEFYAQHVFPDAPEIARDRIAVTLGEAEEAYGPENQLYRAAELYEQYGLVYVPDLARKHLIQLWRNQGWRYAREDHLTSASQAFERAEKIEAGSARKDLDYCEYRRRLEEIRPDDLLGHYRLGLWCKEQGLFEEAIGEFDKTQGQPELYANAQEHVQQIRNETAEKELARLMDQYNQRQFIDVLNGVYDFLQKGYAKSLEDQAKDIESLARESLRLEQIERPQQAEAILQQAMRAYYQERYAEASQRLKIVMDRYRDTLAYPRAKNLYALVRDKLDMADLENGRVPRIDDAPTTPDAVIKHEPLKTRDEIEQLIKAIRSDRNP